MDGLVGLVEWLVGWVVGMFGLIDRFWCNWLGPVWLVGNGLVGWLVGVLRVLVRKSLI